MKQRMIALLIMTAMVVLLREPTYAVNSVVVESKSVAAGGSTTVGVLLTNDVALSALEVPLVVRSVSGGAYMTSWSPSYPVSRLTGKLDGLVSVLFTYPIADGNCKEGQAGGFALGGAADFVSPDGVLFGRLGIGGADDLPAGTDGVPGSGTPSISIAITTNASTGTFEIDTTCMSPDHHLSFVDVLSSFSVPSFTKGIITRPSSQFEGDMDCDGDNDAVDLAILIDIVFFGSPEVLDCGN